MAAVLDGAFPVAHTNPIDRAMFRALDAFRIFELVYGLTGGGPADSNLFSALQFGYGSALSTIMF
jgi:ABC-type sugar transport system permease subunit